MSFGKLYTTEDNIRSIAIKAIAKANKLDLEYVIRPEGGWAPEYLKLNPLGRIPAFEGADGYVLTECIAVAIYITSQNEKTTLLGKTKQDYASIVRWMSFMNSEFQPALGGYLLPILGRAGYPYNKKNVDESYGKLIAAANVLEQHLLVNTYLVGERLTLADLFCAGMADKVFKFVFDKKFRSVNVNLTRWYETVTNQPIYSDVLKAVLADEAIKNVAPKVESKKEKAPKKEPAQQQPKAKKPEPAEEEEDEPAPAPKPKHPLEALPKATLVLDDWKRKYSNEDTRKVALPWFWENYKADEYSLWKLDYKYNEELTQTFMSTNLIGGFFARLEASRKYIFGAASVFGTTNNSIIKGVFVIRGQDAAPAFDVAPDYDSYEFNKLDPSSKADRDFLEDIWDMEKGIEVNGKEYPLADGKVFK